MPAGLWWRNHSRIDRDDDAVDMEIIAEVQKHPNARVFSFGIGSSVNRFLLDNMAAYGRGEVEYVGLEDDGSAAAKRFHEPACHSERAAVQPTFPGMAKHYGIAHRWPCHVMA